MLSVAVVAVPVAGGLRTGITRIGVRGRAIQVTGGTRAGDAARCRRLAVLPVVTPGGRRVGRPAFSDTDAPYPSHSLWGINLSLCKFP